jgi:hypothetical protein
MAESKQYYVKVSFEYGVDNGDGTFTMKNDGGVSWVSMHHDNAVGLENYAVIPALNMMNTKAGELGLLATDIDFPGKLEIEEGANPNKPVK